MIAIEKDAAVRQAMLGEVIAARTGRVVLDPNQFSHDPGVQLTGRSALSILPGL